MDYTKSLIISKDEANIINKYLYIEPDSSNYLNEDSTITNTVTFDDGTEMDIKCCGVQFKEGESNLAWTEAVLFQHGCEVCHSDVGNDYVSEWTLETNGNTYTVCVLIDYDEDVRSIQSQLQSHDNETEYGEAQAFIQLGNNRSLEITHEGYGLQPYQRFYGCRVHCSDEEFNANKFNATIGVVSECTLGDVTSISLSTMLQWAYEAAFKQEQEA